MKPRKEPWSNPGLFLFLGMPPAPGLDIGEQPGYQPEQGQESAQSALMLDATVIGDAAKHSRSQTAHSEREAKEA